MGTPNELTNDQGEVIWLSDYKAWGETRKEMCWGHILVSQGESYARVEGEVKWHDQKLNPLQIEKQHLQPIRFQGQYFDEETGLHYNRFRYYDPDMGMFTSRDPIGLMGGDNVFAYAPNPIGWVDPLGLASTPGSWGSNIEKANDIRRADPNSGYYHGFFGGVCGAEGSTAATWIPDAGNTQACRAHDECYSTCGRTKKECDNEFTANGARLYSWTLTTPFKEDSQKAYDSAQRKSGCCNECTK